MQTAELSPQTSAPTPEIVARPMGRTVFELLARPAVDMQAPYPPGPQPTQRPCQRPTYLGNTFMGIDRDVDPD